MASTWANPHRLDDSLSHTVPPNVQMQWPASRTPVAWKPPCA